MLLQAFPKRKHSWVPKRLNLHGFQHGFYFLFFERSIFHFVDIERSAGGDGV